jgi:hypothetical protein
MWGNVKMEYIIMHAHRSIQLEKAVSNKFTILLDLNNMQQVSHLFLKP